MSESQSNLKLWESVEKTPKEYVKPFKKNNRLSLHTAQAQYVRKTLTGLFGPVGQGWWYKVAYGEIDTSAFADVTLVYSTGKDGEFSIGPHRAMFPLITKYDNGDTRIDNDAYMKACTHGLCKCASELGIASDVYEGMFDNPNYEGDESAIPVLSSQQLTAIRSLLPGTGKTAEDIAKGYSRESLEKVPESKYPNIVAALKRLKPKGSS